MISPEQHKLAEIIKNVHLSLRRRARQIGAENAWAEHLKNEPVLENYANCMKKLAENFWRSNNHIGDDGKCLCRIQWMVTKILDYFHWFGHIHESVKEKRKHELFLKKEGENAAEMNIAVSFEEPYKLLDVGSCYNPFNSFDFLQVFPIDLYPATAGVKKCNFIDMEIIENPEAGWFESNTNILPANFFDIVVFSLFLEYLPSPKQRYLCCEKAYSALKTNGLLLVATPDSKHASANSGIMKTWKLALAHIGFVRIELEKLKYIYCMAFRKATSKKYPILLYNVTPHSSPHELIVIPQDSVDYEEEEVPNRRHDNDDTRVEAFQQLPLSF